MEIEKLYYRVTSTFVNDKLIDIKEDSILSFTKFKSTYEQRGDKDVYKDYFTSESKKREFIHDLKYGVISDII